MARFKVRDRSKSLQLNGSTQYASISDAAQSGLDVGSNDFAIGGWFRLVDDGAIQMLMAKYSGTSYANSTSGLGWELMYRGDQATKRLQLRVNNGSGSGATVQSDYASYNNIADWNWHHIVGVIDRTNGKGIIYIDGVNSTFNDFDDISAETGTYSNSGDLFIGLQSGTGSSNHITGYAQDCFLVDFGAGDIPTDLNVFVSDVYYRDKFPTTIVSKWNLDDAATDSVGSNDLTLTGAPSYSTERKFSARSSV
ncbi:MAG: hypothetical protein GWP19_02640 [Planctomycetia bacterium]|nr:hypothetical protein [Planctomycetia bacterium]